MRNKIILLALALIGILSFTSCSETNEEVNEFENWEARNNEYFQNKYKEAKAYVDAGNPDWKIIKSITKNDSVSSNTHDYIIVEVLNHGTGTGCPLQSDSVMVHYEGRLIPSVSYPEGFIFDCSWQGSYDLSSMIAARFAVAGVQPGFSTALQHMHIGDRWRVTMPQELVYGKEGTGTTIPGYSTLIFDITLKAYARKGTPLPTDR